MVAVAAVVTGWGVGQYPWLLVDEVTIADAAGAPATLQALLVAVGLAVVIVVPALGYLYKLTQSEAWSHHGSWAQPPKFWVRAAAQHVDPSPAGGTGSPETQQKVSPRRVEKALVK